MRRILAIGWLVATIVPLVYVAYMIFVFSHFASPSTLAEERTQFERIFIIQFSVIVFSWGLVASYLVYLFRTKHVASDRKALWAVVLFLGNMFAMPVFWFIYVWRPLKNAAAA